MLTGFGCLGDCCSAKSFDHGPPAPHAWNDRWFPEAKGAVISTHNFHETYLLGEKIGQGTFAHVYTALRLHEDAQSIRCSKAQEKAVRIMDLRDVTQKMRKQVMIEVRVWKILGTHRNCLRLYDVFFGADAEIIYMVMEKSCDLLPYLESMSELNERTLGPVFVQMLWGIKHLHSCCVMHRDVKPDNFLVGDEDGRTIKLIDFGLSSALPKQGKLYGEWGTAPFMCPEMLSMDGYDEKADIWSFAVVVYVLFFGRFPYSPITKTSADMKKSIAAGGEISFKSPHVRSCSVIAFLMTLLNRSPSKRPSAKESLNMAYMVAAADSMDSTSSACENEEEKLPSLHRSLQMAKQIYAFRLRGPSSDGPLDEWLNSVQMEMHGMPLPRVKSNYPHSMGTDEKSEALEEVLDFIGRSFDESACSV